MFAEQQRQQDRGEHRLQVDEQGPDRRPHRNHPGIEADEAEERGDDTRVENAGDRAGMQIHRPPAGELPRVHRRHHQQSDEDESGELQHRMHALGPPLQPDRVDAPGQHRHQHPQVAGVQAEPEQHLETAAADQQQHAGQRHHHADRLGTAQALAEKDERQRDGRHRNEGVEQASRWSRSCIAPPHKRTCCRSPPRTHPGRPPASRPLAASAIAPSDAARRAAARRRRPPPSARRRARPAADRRADPGPSPCSPPRTREARTSSR